TAGYLIYADPSDEAELHRIAILPEYRRHGLARKLMSELLLRTGHVSVEDSQVPNAKSVFLEVRAGNTAAIALYLANHFQEIDRRKNYYHNPDEDAVVMRL
ncbi:MAG: GNAT family N-acetyltransferase, partial [Eubacterium sp.]|nr:GNAT family N-acetyltransferase [Eubacterium sp.]